MEVALALGIVAFCLVTLIGLLPVAMTSNRNAIQQTAVNNIAKAIVADLKSTPSTFGSTKATPGTSPLFKFIIPAVGQAATSGSSAPTVYFAAAGNAGLLDANATASSVYRATLFFTPPAAGVRAATIARILITWPAQADPDPNKLPTTYTGSYETIISLDRN
ncbi:MAG: hypothetical protein ABSE62_11815 [Chthoniobacteraceae bacterium]